MLQMSELNIRDFKGVAWDFDGILAASVPIHTESRREAYQREADTKDDSRYVEISEEIHTDAHHHGSTPERINAWIMGQVGIIDDPDDVGHQAVKDLCFAKNQIYHTKAAEGKLPAVPGVLQIVRSFNVDRPGKQVVASTASPYEVLPFLRANGLNNYFPARRLILKSHPEVHQTKPSPDAYLAAAKALGINRLIRMLAFEDSEQGIESARRAGAFVIAVATTHSQDRLNSLGGLQRPHLIAADFFEVAKIFGLPGAA